MRPDAHVMPDQGLCACGHPLARRGKMAAHEAAPHRMQAAEQIYTQVHEFCT